MKYLKYNEDGIRYTKGTRIKIPMICPNNCGYEKEMRIGDLIRDGFGCPNCSSGYYTEKFVFSVLKSLDKNFKTQLNKKDFKWCEKYKYDNYIYSHNCIIETHGRQHFEEVKCWKMDLDNIQKNDKQKERLARRNGIDNYIVLDCRKSELEWIKNNIMGSELPELLNFKESDIDWLKCEEFSLRNLVKAVCDEWMKGNKNVAKIAEILKIGETTVRRYLKRGAKLEWCNYDSKAESKKHFIYVGERESKKVICINTNEIFKSQAEAERKYNIHNGISRCCLKKQKSAGKHPETGERLIWMFYDEAIKIEEEDDVVENANS